jgi:hypothetical protein
MWVKLRINHELRQGLNLDSPNSQEISISVPIGESILGMISHLAKGDPVLWKSIFDEKDQIIQPNVMVILNDRIVNPYDPSEAGLKDGDELAFLPMFDGG